jgi:hypothetical protein
MSKPQQASLGGLVVIVCILLFVAATPHPTALGYLPDLVVALGAMFVGGFVLIRCRKDLAS